MSSDYLSVLLVDSDRILSAGIKILLAGDTRLRLTSVAFKGEDELIRQIIAKRPKVVVLTSDQVSEANVKLQKLLETSRRFRLLVIDQDVSRVDVYDERQSKHEVMVRGGSDLLSIVNQKQMAGLN